SEESENKLENCTKGINDNIKSLIRLASHKITTQGDRINTKRKSRNKKDFEEQPEGHNTDNDLQDSTLSVPLDTNQTIEEEKMTALLEDTDKGNEQQERKNETA
ncbi:MAG: hypothetical protein GX091_09150, partial [Peptococcaceae bacterium]|nr:hypothetical protein [Peptococcaceae bacterium]